MAWSYEVLDTRAEAMLEAVARRAEPYNKTRALAQQLRAALDELCQDAFAAFDEPDGYARPSTAPLLPPDPEREAEIRNALAFALEYARVKAGLTASTPRRKEAPRG